MAAAGSKRTINAMIRRMLATPEPVHRGRVFGIFDAARDDRIYTTVTAPGTIVRCLYGSDLPHPLELAAPYLVAMNEGVRIGHLFASAGRNESWGVLLRSELSMDDLAQRLHRLVRRERPGGVSALFRFYDPRVLRSFLPDCGPGQLDPFFDGVEAYLIEQGDGAWRSYRRDDTGALVLRDPSWDLWIE